MIKQPKSPLSKRKREVQHNLVTCIVILLPKHQLCGWEDGAQWTGRERLGGVSGEKEPPAMSDKAGPGLLNLGASTDSTYNTICHSSPFKVGVHHIEREN